MGRINLHVRNYRAIESADMMVIVMFVPVSPSGTGKTFSSFIHSFFASRFLAPLRNIFESIFEKRPFIPSTADII